MRRHRFRDLRAAATRSKPAESSAVRSATVGIPASVGLSTGPSYHERFLARLTRRLRRARFTMDEVGEIDVDALRAVLEVDEGPPIGEILILTHCIVCMMVRNVMRAN